MLAAMEYVAHEKLNDGVQAEDYLRVFLCME
jgi:hypothetical protein